MSAPQGQEPNLFVNARQRTRLVRNLARAFLSAFSFTHGVFAAIDNPIELSLGDIWIYPVAMTTQRRTFLTALAGIFVNRKAMSEAAPSGSQIIDDLSAQPPGSTIGTEWRLFTDTVMGGVSRATMTREMVDARAAIRLQGDVRLDNNGGFVQISLDFRQDGGAIDASAWRGIELDVFGNGEEYALNLRTSDLDRPWQSYRQAFRADSRWRTVQLAFNDFSPSRTEIPLNAHRLRRLGIIAIGRAFHADISVGGVRFFR